MTSKFKISKVIIEIESPKLVPLIGQLGQKSTLVPGIAFCNKIISGFANHHFLNCTINDNANKSEALFEILQLAYQDLSFAEWSILRNYLENVFQTEFNSLELESLLSQFAKSLHFNDSDFNKSVQDKLLLTPNEFQQWAHEKNLAAGDLAPLLSIEVELMSDFLLKIPQINSNKNWGVKILELLVDLILMEIPKIQLSPAESNDEAWAQYLMKLRNPITAKIDEQKYFQLNEVLKTTSLPRGSSLKMVRNGDRRYLEFKLQISQPQDLKKITQAIPVLEKGIETIQ